MDHDIVRLAFFRPVYLLETCSFTNIHQWLTICTILSARSFGFSLHNLGLLDEVGCGQRDTATYIKL